MYFHYYAFWCKILSHTKEGGKKEKKKKLSRVSIFWLGKLVWSDGTIGIEMKGLTFYQLHSVPSRQPRSVTSKHTVQSSPRVSTLSQVPWTKNQSKYLKNTNYYTQTSNAAYHDYKAWACWCCQPFCWRICLYQTKEERKCLNKLTETIENNKLL